MGLEAATHIQDLDAANPLAGDRKNQGDDHLRLLKTVLRTSFPDASRPLRYAKILSKSANYTVLDTDDNTTVLCDTTAGAFNLTLPAGLAYAGWTIKIVKTSLDVNPVFVVPPSGTINGLAKMRCNVPFMEYVFLWTGAVFLRMKAPGEASPGTLEQFGGASAPVGYGFATGQSLLRADYPELFAAWGVSHGSVDGTHFTAPDLRDRFIAGAGSSYGIGATGGEATHILSAAEMPAHAHGITQNPHDHAVTGGIGGSTANSTLQFLGGGVSTGVSPATIDITPANADITINNTGGDGAHENRPPYYALWFMFRLC